MGGCSPAVDHRGPLASSLAPLEPLASILDAWRERQALAGDGSLADLAGAYETRKRPPETGDPWSDRATDPWPSRNPNAALTPGAPATRHAAGTAPTHLLGLTREVISAVTSQVVAAAQPQVAPYPVSPELGTAHSSDDRYLAAAIRVDEAFGLVEQHLEAATAGAAGWSADSLRRQDALAKRLAATRRRRLAMRECVQGNLCAPFFRCRCCGQVKIGQPMTCQHRACPRCVEKLRLANQAKVHAILEHVDETRSARHRAPASWRFITLTIPSSPRFDVARERLCGAWSRMLRGGWWRRAGIGAAVIACETTRTAAGWHVHLHGIVDAYLPRAGFVHAWQLAALHAMTPTDNNTAAVVLRAVVDEAARRRRRKDLSEITTYASQIMEQRAGLIADRAVRVRTRRTCRLILAALPTGAGQHVSRPEGSRQKIVRELAKYLAKDLGVGSGERDSTHGVMGTAAAGAEFLLGTFRWRSLRCYGAALGAKLREHEREMRCDDCGGAVEHDTTRWLTPADLAQIAEDKRRKRQRRQHPTDHEEATAPPTPVRVRKDPDAKLHHLIRRMEIERRCKPSDRCPIPTMATPSVPAGARTRPRRRPDRSAIRTNACTPYAPGTVSTSNYHPITFRPASGLPLLIPAPWGTASEADT